LVSFATEPWH